MKKAGNLLLLIIILVTAMSCNKGREQGVIPSEESFFSIENVSEYIHTPMSLDQVETVGGSFNHTLSFYDGLAFTSGFDVEAIIQFEFRSTDSVLNGHYAVDNVVVVLDSGRGTVAFIGGVDSLRVTLEANGTSVVSYDLSVQGANPCIGEHIVVGAYEGVISKTSDDIELMFDFTPTMEGFYGFTDILTEQCHETSTAFINRDQLDIYNTEYELLISDESDYSGAYINILMYSGDSLNLAPGTYRPGLVSAGNFRPIESEISTDGGNYFTVTDGEIVVFKDQDVYTFFYSLSTNGGPFEGYFQGELESF